MSIIQAMILGIVQGLTELLPVSSSAHIKIFPWLFNWGVEATDSFEVALHIGTLLAILVFFYKDWIALIKGGYKQAFKKEKSVEGKMFWQIFISTVIAGVLCLVLDKVSGNVIEGIAGKIGVDKISVEMIFIAIALIVMGIILYIVDKKAKTNLKCENITLKQSILIGCSQAIAAAFPGVSRSGITITVGRAFGIKREDIAKYSFLLSAPIVAAAAIYELKDIFTLSLPAVLVGIAVSFLVGMLVIKFLLNYLKKGSYKAFAIYRCIIGIIIMIICIVR